MNAARIQLVPLDDVFPVSATADAIDEVIEAGLPRVPGMEEAHTAEERQAVFSAVVRAQRAEFVELYGEPFGIERRSEPRDDTMVADARPAKLLAAD